MKDIFAVIGVASMLALSIVLFIVFVAAYTSPAKAARVHIDNYGEANAEMIFLSFLMPLNIISTFIVTKRLTEKNKLPAIQTYQTEKPLYSVIQTAEIENTKNL